jgi:prevent-host-death family protein
VKIAIAEAKAQFAEIIRRAEAGEDIELTRYGRAVARVVAVEAAAKKPLIGALAGKFTVPDMNSGDAEVAQMFGSDT